MWYIKNKKDKFLENEFGEIVSFNHKRIAEEMAQELNARNRKKREIFNAKKENVSEYSLHEEK